MVWEILLSVPATSATLCQVVPCFEPVLFAELTPGLSVHAGEGLVGVVLVRAAS